MKNFSHNDGRSLAGDGVQFAAIFLVCGLVAGACFTWLTHTRELEDFFFIPFSARRARTGWFVAASVILAVSLAVGSLIALHKADLRQKAGLSIWRSIIAFAIVCVSVPLVNLPAGNYTVRLQEQNSLALIMWIVFPPVLAAAMVMLAGDLRLVPAAFLASTIFSAVGFVLCIPVMLILFWIFDEPSQFALDLLQWSFLYSSLSLSFGCWLLYLSRTKRTNAPLL